MAADDAQKPADCDGRAKWVYKDREGVATGAQRCAEGDKTGANIVSGCGASAKAEGRGSGYCGYNENTKQNDYCYYCGSNRDELSISLEAVSTGTSSFQIKASFSGTATGNIGYKLYCDSSKDTPLLGTMSGNIQNVMNPYNCVYDNPGTYIVKVEATRGGKSASGTTTVTVNPTLTFTVVANPATGTKPLTNVEITTTGIGGTATGPISLKLDCLSDGSWDEEIPNLNLDSVNSYTFIKKCSYQNTGTVRVRGERGIAVAIQTATVTITQPGAPATRYIVLKDPPAADVAATVVGKDRIRLTGIQLIGFATSVAQLESDGCALRELTADNVKGKALTTITNNLFEPQNFADMPYILTPVTGTLEQGKGYFVAVQGECAAMTQAVTQPKIILKRGFNAISSPKRLTQSQIDNACDGDLQPFTFNSVKNTAKKIAAYKYNSATKTGTFEPTDIMEPNVGYIVAYDPPSGSPRAMCEITP